jgi:hypothetical protein
MVEEEKNIAEMYDAITVSLFFLIQNKANGIINYKKIQFKAYLNAHVWGVADINVFYSKIGKIVGLKLSLNKYCQLLKKNISFF